MKSIDEFIKIKHVVIYGPLSKPMLKIESTEKEKEIFHKNKKNAEIFMKYAEFYPNCYAISFELEKKRKPWTYKKIDHIQRKNGDKNKCIYYIPSDIYPYLIYDGSEMKVKVSVPKNLKIKAENCAKFFELELNYLKYIMNVNFEENSIFDFENKLRKFKPSIIIDNTTNKLSFGYKYEDIIDNDYIQKYNELEKEEKRMIKSGEYII